jgi:VanZ family protein
MASRGKAINFLRSKYGRVGDGAFAAFRWPTFTMRLMFGGYFCYLTLLLLAPNPFPWVSSSPRVVHYLDLIYPIAHCISFTFLTVLALLAFRFLSPYEIGAGLMGYAASTELLQMLIPPRAAEWQDFFQDLGGIAIGFMVAWMLLSGWRWLRNFKEEPCPEIAL